MFWRIFPLYVGLKLVTRACCGPGSTVPLILLQMPAYVWPLVTLIRNCDYLWQGVLISSLSFYPLSFLFLSSLSPAGGRGGTSVHFSSGVFFFLAPERYFLALFFQCGQPGLLLSSGLGSFTFLWGAGSELCNLQQFALHFRSEPLLLFHSLLKPLDVLSEWSLSFFNMLML